MKTPIKFSKTIDKGIVTEEILGEVIYSYNKRAKNMRDKAIEYSYYYNCRDYYFEYKSKKEHYYKCKDKLLLFMKPIAIHSVVRERYRRIYKGEFGFKSAKKNGEEVLKDNNDRKYVCVKETFTEYFLYYKIGNFSFHHPTIEHNIKKYYSHLEIIDIGDLETYGAETSNLLSVQFCDKVLKGLEEKTLSLAA